MRDPVEEIWIERSTVRAPVRKGESLTSVAIRLAGTLGYNAPGELVAEMLGIQDGELASLPVWQNRAGLFGILNGMTEAELQAGLVLPAHEDLRSRVRIGSLILDRDQFETARMRIAPGQLARDLEQHGECWHRRTWSIRCLPADPATGEVLIDRCPSCGSPLWWRDLVAVSQCPSEECRLPLDRLPPTFLADREREWIKPLGDLLGPEETARGRLRSSLPAEAQGWPEADILDTADWLAALEDRLAGGPATTLGLEHRARGLSRLQGWPGSVDDLLDCHWAPRAGAGRLARLRAAAFAEAAVQDLRSLRGRALMRMSCGRSADERGSSDRALPRPRDKTALGRDRPLGHNPLRGFHRFLEARALPLLQASSQDFQDFVGARFAASDTPNTVISKLSHVRQFYEWCVAESLIPTMPVIPVQTRDQPSNRPPAALEDVERLFAAADRSITETAEGTPEHRRALRMKLWLHLLVETAAWPGEIVVLTPYDLMPTTRAIRLGRGTARDRIRGLSPDGWAVLCEYRVAWAAASPSSPIFPTWESWPETPVSPPTVTRLLQRLCKAADLPETIMPTELARVSGRDFQVVPTEIVRRAAVARKTLKTVATEELAMDVHEMRQALERWHPLGRR